MALGALDIIIAADTAQLRRGMDTAVGIMQSSTRTMENVAKTAATAIAGVFAFNGIKDSITQTLNLADSLSKMSQKVGVSVDALYAMQAAGKLADVSMESLEKGLLKFNKGLGTAQMGSGDTANALKNLGISLKDSSGHLRNSDQYLNEVADKFKSMPDGIAKSTLSMQLFGKSGADLIPLLNGGSESLKEFSGIMDANTGKAAERLNDSFTRMGLAFEGNKVQIMNGLLPAMESLSGFMEESSKSAGGLVDSLSNQMPIIEGVATATVVLYTASKMAAGYDALRVISITASNEAMAISTAQTALRTAMQEADSAAQIAGAYAVEMRTIAERVATTGVVNNTIATTAQITALQVEATRAEAAALAQTSHALALESAGVAAAGTATSVGIMGTVMKAVPFVAVAATVALLASSFFEAKKDSDELNDSLNQTADTLVKLTKAQLENRKAVVDGAVADAYTAYKGAKQSADNRGFFQSDKDYKSEIANVDTLKKAFDDTVKARQQIKDFESGILKPTAIPPKTPPPSTDLIDFKAKEAEREAARKKATAEREKAYQEEIKIQKGYLDSYADLEAKDAIEAYNNKIIYLNDYADREAKAAIDQYNLDLFYIDDLASRQASYAVSLYDSITPDSEKIISKYTDIFETMKDMPVEVLKSFGDKMNEELANIKSGMDFSANIEFDPSMMDGVAKSIAGVSKSMMLLTKEEDQYQKNKLIAGATAEALAENEEKHNVAQIAGYANIAGAMSSMFEQGSKEAEAFKAIEAGLAIVSGAKAVVQAMTNGDPYTAIARGVAMAAMVASVLGSAGVSGGSGSASTPAPATSMGTVLGGGAYGQSESMTAITDLLSSIHTSEYSQLRDINRAVTSMSENILSAVTNIFRSGITDTGGVQLNSFDNAQERIDKTLAIIDKSFLNIGGIMSNAFMASGAGLFQALGFGGSSKQYIAGSGFNVAGGTIGDKASGNVGASTYVDVETASKNFFGSASYSHNITRTALDSASSQSIALIYRSFSDTMLSINKGLGTDLGNSISGYAVKAINISTAGLTGDEVVKKLNNTFSALGDTMANDVFGTILSQYQKLGEGMLETAVRVITEKEVLLQDLANVNKTITGNVLDITQSLVDLSGGLTKFSDANSSYFDNYFTDAEKSAVYQKNLESAYKSMNVTMPTTIAGFRSTVDALDLNTASGRETYVSLMNIADAQKTYMDSLKDLTDLVPKPDMMLSKTNDGTVIFKQIQDDNTTMKLMYADMLRTMKSMLTIQQFGVVVA